MVEPTWVAAVVCGCVFVSEWLVAHTALRHAGTALLVIAVTAIVSNAGVIPTSNHPVYDGVFAHVAPLAIFWLLLRVQLRAVLRAGGPLLILFLIGSAGAVIGAVVAMKLLGPEALGAHGAALAGMFAATYTGGSANFNALALHYDLVSQGAIYAGAMAVDSGITALWMVVTLALPRWLATAGMHPSSASDPADREPVEASDVDRESLTPHDVAILAGLGLLCHFGSAWLAQRLEAVGLSLPPILILTALALGLAQLRPVARLGGTSVLGMFAVYVFLAVIGASCDFAALSRLGMVGVRVAVLASVCVGIHGLLTFGAAAVLRFDPVLAAVASQANVGGGTTALALARSLQREDLVLPAILVGSLGTALGTFLGFWVAEALV